MLPDLTITVTFRKRKLVRLCAEKRTTHWGCYMQWIIPVGKHTVFRLQDTNPRFVRRFCSRFMSLRVGNPRVVILRRIVEVDLTTQLPAPVNEINPDKFLPAEICLVNGLISRSPLRTGQIPIGIWLTLKILSPFRCGEVPTDPLTGFSDPGLRV